MLKDNFFDSDMTAIKGGFENRKGYGCSKSGRVVQRTDSRQESTLCLRTVQALDLEP